MLNEDSQYEISHLRKAAARLNEKRCTERSLTDVTISCREEEFPAHKCILSASSEFFSEHFETSPQVKSIALDVLEPFAVEALLGFIYTGKLRITESTDVGTLLANAMYLRLDFAVQYCFQHILETTAADDSVLVLIELVDQAGSTHLIQDMVLKHLARNFSTFHQSEAFNRLPPSYFGSLLSHANLQCSTDVKFEAVKKWIQYDLHARGDSVESLVGAIDISDLSIEYLNKATGDTFISSNIALMGMIMKEMCRRLQFSMQRSSSSVSLNCDHLARPVSKHMSNVRSSSVSRLPEAFSEKDFDDTSHCFLDSLHKLPVNSILLITNDDTTTHLFGYSPSSREYAKESFPSRGIVLPKEAAVTAVGDAIYFVGGRVSSSQASATTYALHIRKKKWERKADLKAPRFASGVAALDGRIYVVGGINDKRVKEKSVLCYNTYSNAWKTLSSMHTRRESPAVCAVNRCLYVVGGYSLPYPTVHSKDNRDEASTLGEKYDITSNQWTKIGVTSSVGGPVHQKLYNIAVLDGSIYTMRKLAPKSTHGKRFFYEYSMTTDKVKDISLKINLSDVIFMADYGGNLCFVDDNGRVVIYSVKTQQIVDSDVIRYAPFLTNRHGYYIVTYSP